MATNIRVRDLVYPYFVVAGQRRRERIPELPGIFRWTVDGLLRDAEKTVRLGIPAVLLFGLPAKKDPLGKDAYSDRGIIQTAVRAIKDAVPGLMVVTDVCFCEYTDHGHCGILKGTEVDNDATLEILAKSAVSHAKAGADIVAPSDMMDGRVGAIRKALDRTGFSNVPIMSYAAKYAGGFYGPFRDAAESAPSFGDRRSYQMDPSNAREALREVALDVREGADIVMVKPALAYLDIIHRVRQAFDLPVAAYNVSGEYAMVKAASKLGWIDGDRVTMEILVSIKRAGADLIITYAAKEAALALAG